MQNAKLQNWGSFTILGIIRYHLYLTQMKWYTTEKLANTNCLPGLLKFLVENILNYCIDIMASCSCKWDCFYILQSPFPFIVLVVQSHPVFSDLLFCLLVSISWASCSSASLLDLPKSLIHLMGRDPGISKQCCVTRKKKLRWCTYCMRKTHYYYIWTVDKE